MLICSVKNVNCNLTTCLWPHLCSFYSYTLNGHLSSIGYSENNLHNIARGGCRFDDLIGLLHLLLLQFSWPYKATSKSTGSSCCFFYSKVNRQMEFPMALMLFTGFRTRAQLFSFNVTELFIISFLLHPLPSPHVFSDFLLLLHIFILSPPTIPAVRLWHTMVAVNLHQYNLIFLFVWKQSGKQWETKLRNCVASVDYVELT